MKIAYIVNLFPRLYHTFTLNDMVALKERGIEILIFSMSKPGEAVVNQDAISFIKNTYYFESFSSENKNSLIKFIDSLSRKLRLRKVIYRFLTPLFLPRMISEVGIQKYYLDLGWRVDSLKGICEKIKLESVDVVHGAFGSESATAAMIISQITGIPFTFETHAKDLYVLFRHAREKVEKAKKIFTISEYNRKYLLEHVGCSVDKIVVKRVLFNKKACDNITDSQRRDNLIISVCRLDVIKGLEYGIDAFHILSKKWRDLRYLIIGDGPLRSKLEDKTRKLGLERKVIFLGSIRNEEVLRFISEATLILLPSVVAKSGDRDGIPTALIEAMYLKTPVISSNISGIPELIDDGVNGYLTDQGDINAIGRRIEDLLADKELRSKMGKEARRKIDAEFNVDINVLKLISAWEEFVP
jgi:glycosyltransferase involved in cell wall biosynthesis